MPRCVEPGRSMPLPGMGELPLRLRDVSGIFTVYRYDDGTALMPVVNCQEQLPVPFVATHQEKLSLPVIVVHSDQVSDISVHVTVVPGGERQRPVHVFVTADSYKPSLPGVIVVTEDAFGDSPRYYINTVVITPKDRPPLPDPDWQCQGPAMIARKGQVPPHAFTPCPFQDLPLYTTDQERLSLPVHVRYKFLAPDAPDAVSPVVPSDRYCNSFRPHGGYI
jgi:hypothetical protein